MQKLEFNTREMMHLSELINSQHDSLTSELECLNEELEEQKTDLELDELHIELSQDLAFCTSIQQKIEKYFNSPEFTGISEG